MCFIFTPRWMWKGHKPANNFLLIGTTLAVRGVSTGCKECDYRIKEAVSISFFILWTFSLNSYEQCEMFLRRLIQDTGIIWRAMTVWISYLEVMYTWGMFVWQTSPQGKKQSKSVSCLVWINRERQSVMRPAVQRIRVLQLCFNLDSDGVKTAGRIVYPYITM